MEKRVFPIPQKVPGTTGKAWLSLRQTTPTGARVGRAVSLLTFSCIPSCLVEQFQPPHAPDCVAPGGDGSSHTLSLVADMQLHDPHVSDDTMQRRATDPSELLRIE
jgi:hypothetical protein